MDTSYEARHISKTVFDQLTANGNDFSLDEITETLTTLSNAPIDLIVTHLPGCVYKEPECKKTFESMFQAYDANCQFIYLPSFCRAKVIITGLEAGLTARHELNEAKIVSHPTHPESGLSAHDVQIRVYFSQKPNNLLANLGISTGNHLHPPELQKQFLISPPASPPDNWNPHNEKSPLINLELLAALSKLEPGETHELQAAEDDKPGIFLTPCEDNYGSDEKSQKPKIVHTKCPSRPQ